MHYCGIIIKRKETSIVEARKSLGEVLVERGLSDWYATDDYRERSFADDKKTIPLAEFKEQFFSEAWLDHDGNDVWPLAILDEEAYIQEMIIPYGFWEMYGVDDYRERLDDLYKDAYVRWCEKYIGKITGVELYDVVLLDYHN